MGTGRFVIVWDISKVEKIVNNERVIRRKITISELYEIVDKSGSEYETKSYNAEKPPVIAYYKPFNTYVIIDGNHRIYDAYHSGKKEIIKSIGIFSIFSIIWFVILIRFVIEIKIKKMDYLF